MNDDELTTKEMDRLADCLKAQGHTAEFSSASSTSLEPRPLSKSPRTPASSKRIGPLTNLPQPEGA